MHITAQSGPVIRVLLCHSHWSSKGGINDTCYENLWSNATKGNVCMVITYSRVWINRVRLPILLVVSWTGKIILPWPRACLRIWSRETGSAVPSRVSLLISILRLNLVLTYGIPPEFRGGVHLWNRHTPSGQSRVYRVTQLRTDGVHCRESAGTGPVNLKVVPVTGAALADHHGPINIRLSFPHPLLEWSGHAESTGVSIAGI